MSNPPQTDFIPAAHYHAWTPFYGGFMNIFFGRQYQRLADLIALAPGESLLDVGCGPGQLLKLLNTKYPKNSLTGIDIDPTILAIARKQLPDPVQLITSSADLLPLPDNSVDVVTSTLMIHHLHADQKEKMIRECFRVLKPGGRFFLLDFTKPYHFFGKLFVKLFRHAEHMDDAMDGKYPVWIRQAGFQEATSLYKLYGVIELLKTFK